MNAVARRIDKLEERFGTADGKSRILVVVVPAGLGLALDQDRCIAILDECGFLPTRGVGVVDLGKIPKGLNAEELERFLSRLEGGPIDAGQSSPATTDLDGCEEARAIDKIAKTRKP